MPKNVKNERYALMIKYWKDGNEKAALEGTMTTDSLRSARAEFRSKLKDLLAPAEISAADMKPIVEAGYVVAAGPVLDNADRFAMLLTDRENPASNPPMYAFQFTGKGWSMQCFEPGK